MLELNATFLVQLGIFLVVMISLNFLVFRPLGRLQESRRKTFLDLEKAAADMEKQKLGRAAEYERRAEELKAEIQRYKSSMKGDFERERQKIIDEARRKSDDLMAREEEDLKAEVARARQVLKTQTRLLAESVFSKVMGRGIGAAH